MDQAVVLGAVEVGQELEAQAIHLLLALLKVLLVGTLLSMRLTIQPLVVVVRVQ